MPTYIAKSAQLRTDAAKIMEGLSAVNSYVIMHYKSALGYLTPDIPEELLKKMGLKKRETFREI